MLAIFPQTQAALSFSKAVLCIMYWWACIASQSEGVWWQRESWIVILRAQCQQYRNGIAVMKRYLAYSGSQDNGPSTCSTLSMSDCVSSGNLHQHNICPCSCETFLWTYFSWYFLILKELWMGKVWQIMKIRVIQTGLLGARRGDITCDPAGPN